MARCLHNRHLSPPKTWMQYRCWLYK